MKFVMQFSGMANIRRIALAGCAVAAMGAVPAASAGVLSWTLAGPGTTSVNHVGSNTSLNYSLNGAAVHQTQTWVATAIADEATDYIFKWNYSGFHSFFRVTAFLNANDPLGTSTLVNAGPTNCCSAPSSGFAYAGTYTFSNVKAGDVLQFRFGGRNADRDMRLFGALALDQTSVVPEPASMALLGLGLAGLAAVRRKRGSRVLPGR